MLITLETLPLVLAELGVPREDYSIGHQADDAWCLTEIGDGRWQVAYREHGTEFDVSVLDSAEDACYLLLGRLALQQLNERVIGVIAPPTA